MRRAAWTLALITLAVALVGPASPAAPAGESGAENRDVALAVDDRVRHYLLHVPPALAAGTPLPVLIALHAGGSSAAQFQRYAGLDRLADREGFAVVYPQGSGRVLLSWNAGEAWTFIRRFSRPDAPPL